MVNHQLYQHLHPQFLDMLLLIIAGLHVIKNKNMSLFSKNRKIEDVIGEQWFEVVIKKLHIAYFHNNGDDALKFSL